MFDRTHYEEIFPRVRFKDKEPVPLDPWCDPDKPRVVQYEEVKSATLKIKDGIRNTPCVRSHLFDDTGMEIFLKKDFLQYTGSFKERGARFTMLNLSDAERKSGVVSASAGNHAQAMSWHGQLLDIPITVVMPIVAPIMKIQKCRAYNANVIVQGADMTEAKNIALRLAKEKGMTYVNGYDHPHVIAGQGTCGVEIVEQVENIDAVIIPMGGGGLIAGISLAIKSLNPKIQIIGVESEACPGFSKSLSSGKPIPVPCLSTLADGLAVGLVGCNAVATGKLYIDKTVLVPEEYIALAILRLIELEKCVVEGAGATGLAAILSGQLNELKGKRVVLVLSGGNIDSAILGRCINRGLAAEGRMVKAKVIVSDRPGGLADLCKLIASIGVNIKEIFNERAWVASDIFSLEVKVICETRDYEHSIELQELLKKNYKTCFFVDFPVVNKKKMLMNTAGKTPTLQVLLASGTAYQGCGM